MSEIARMAHTRCLVWVYVRAPSAASARKLAKWPGQAGRNGVSRAAAYRSHASRAPA